MIKGRGIMEETKGRRREDDKEVEGRIRREEKNMEGEKKGREEDGKRR